MTRTTKRKNKALILGGGAISLVSGEHWNVIQPETTKEKSKSKLPMFGDSFSQSHELNGHNRAIETYHYDDDNKCHRRQQSPGSCGD
jgi:hypothetical protein